MALISANLYPQKQEDTLNKQENLMNSNKQSCSTIKNTLIPEEPCMYTIPKPTTISDRVEVNETKAQT